MTTDGVKHRRTVTATRSYLSQSELPVTFGLGAEGEVEGLAVVWPDSERQELALPIEPGQELVVRR